MKCESCGCKGNFEQCPNKCSKRDPRKIDIASHPMDPARHQKTISDLKARIAELEASGECEHARANRWFSYANLKSLKVIKLLHQLDAKDRRIAELEEKIEDLKYEAVYDSNSI